MRKFLFGFIIVVLAGGIFFGDSWKGKIYNKNGVKIIENYESGFHINKKIRFKETLSIGKDDGEDYLLFPQWYMVDVKAASDGSIYVYNGKKYKLMKFDKNGKLLWITGRKGEGPGEFKSGFCDIYLAPENKIVVVDNLFIRFFNSKGKYLKSIKTDKRPMHLDFLKNGDMFFTLILRGQPGFAAAFYSKEGKFISKFPVEYRYGKKLPHGGGISISGGSIRLYKHRVIMTPPDKYEIREYDLKGKLLKIIKRKVKLSPPNIKFRADGGIEVYPSDVSGPTRLYKNNIFVNSVTKVKEYKKNRYSSKKYLDFFNREGKYLGSYKLPEGTNLKTIDSQGNFYFFQDEPVPRIFRAKLLKW